MSTFTWVHTLLSLPNECDVTINSKFARPPSAAVIAVAQRAQR
jgi:hypothetical protein